MNRTSFALVAACVLTGLTGLSACGAGGSGAHPLVPPASASAAPSGAALAVTTVGALGEVVTGADGKTLYRFDKDTTKPPASHCDGQCAVQWPPVLADSATPAVQGIDQRLVGTVTRADGAKQLTLNGWPLYRFFKDTALGQANGQGVGGLWFAATPEGAKASEVASVPSSGQAGGYGGGY